MEETVHRGCCIYTGTVYHVIVGTCGGDQDSSLCSTRTVQLCFHGMLMDDRGKLGLQPIGNTGSFGVLSS